MSTRHYAHWPRGLPHDITIPATSVYVNLAVSAARYPDKPEEKKRFLERLTAAETLERYLHTKYVGQKRFSLEGGEATIVSLDELVRVAGTLGVEEIVVGMAHRCRPMRWTFPLAVQ